MTPEEVEILMLESSSEEDWNRRCDIVKKAHGGYPDFWFSRVVASGLGEFVRRSWRP